ncbi:MAG: site-specific DNA-methyltransferase [Treponema sp.]|nr:site-specific DNA-methyltransferase [Treponema sp.]
MEKSRAKNNRTLTLEPEEMGTLRGRLLDEQAVRGGASIENRILHGDMMRMLQFVPDEFADLIIIDPPYNLTKDFNGLRFNSRSSEKYEEYLDSWFPQVCKKLKADGSLYLCGDWKCTAALQRTLEKELVILNRITWQREKGRGAKANWKNGMEDIWFAVKNPDDYFFNLDAVKIRRKVLAPYKVNGVPKDWEEGEAGNFRLTCPSNFWDDISVPFWSMPENTDHPTQKSEKLYAKLILASSEKGDMIFDPFMGSGTACVTAKKLGRRFCGIELNEEYCLLAQKRLERAEKDTVIQGYEDGVFWERNAR